MGQQQLLLVILVTIIVGIATVVAINTFGTAADSANIDAVRQDVATIAAAAQSYYMKPQMLGGGGRSFEGVSFNGIAFASGGVSSNGLIAQNENGRYVLENAGADAQEFTITVHPASDDSYVPGTIDEDGFLTGGTDAGDPGVSTVSPNQATPLSFNED